MKVVEIQQQFTSDRVAANIWEILYLQTQLLQ